MPAVAAGVEDIHTDNEDLLIVNLLPVSAPWTCHLCDHLPSYFGTLLDLVHQPPTNACMWDRLRVQLMFIYDVSLILMMPFESVQLLIKLSFLLMISFCKGTRYLKIES